MIDFHLMAAKCPLNHKPEITMRIGIGHGKYWWVLFISSIKGMKIVQFLR